MTMIMFAIGSDMRFVNVKRTSLILIATTVVIVTLISVGLATYGALASERKVMLPPNSSFVAICPLEFIGGGLVLAGTCVSGNLTVVEFRAVGDELALNFTLYDRRGGTYKKGAEWPRFMTPLEIDPEYRELVKRLRVNASIYLVDQGGQEAGGGRAILGSPRILYSLMMEHTALVVDNKTLIVVVTFRAWRMNEEIKEGTVIEYVEKKLSRHRELVRRMHLRDVEEALKSYFKKK
jgi:hypothetical protein